MADPPRPAGKPNEKPVSPACKKGCPDAEEVRQAAPKERPSRGAVRPPIPAAKEQDAAPPARVHDSAAGRE